MTTVTFRSHKYLGFVIFALVLILFFGFIIGIDLRNGIYVIGLIMGLNYVILCMVCPFMAFIVLILLGLTVWVSSIQLVAGISLMIGVGGIFLALWLLRILSRNLTFVMIKELWYVLGLAIIIVLSTLLNWGGPAGFVPALSYIQLILLTVLIVNFVDSPTRLQQLGNIIIIASVLTAGLIILDQWGLFSAKLGLVKSAQGAVYYAGSYQAFERAGGIYGDPNMAALQLTAALPFIMEYWSGSSKHLKVWLFLSGLGILLAFSYTVSMGGLVGIASILMIKVLLVSKQNIFIKTAQVSVIGLVGFWLSLKVLPGYYLDRISINIEQVARFLQTPSENLFLQLGSTRGDAWLAAFKTFLHSPIIGNGPGNSNFISSLNSAMWHSGSQLAAHNFLLSVASDLGILGLFFFASLLLYTLWVVRPFEQKPSAINKLQPTGSAIFVALWACVIQGMGLDIHVQKILWVLLGMGLVYKQLLLNKGKYENKMAGN